MPRIRLGVVLLIPPPLDAELNAFRRAVGDGTYGRVPVHVTLVPPVNVNTARSEDALRVIRQGASETRPFTIRMGAPATFLPANPVLYLPLVGDGRATVFALRDRVFQEPLARPLSWPFVPHVTLADEADPERISAAELALADFTAEATFERVHVLQETPGRVWLPIADAPFAAPVVVGRGGLPVELTVVERLDPHACALADSVWTTEEAAPGTRPLAVVARRDERVVGSAEGWTGGGVAFLSRLVVAPDVRGGGVGSQLLAAFESVAADRGGRRLAAAAPAGSDGERFLRGRGWAEECRVTDWYGGADQVRLRRDR
ncbi:MAG: GNAT family N-acetyltransferase [Actinomycetota bacterium]|nr:GNAT family N-acetyltransferase [Actinomycetota bacterium]